MIIDEINIIIGKYINKEINFQEFSNEMKKYDEEWVYDELDKNEDKNLLEIVDTTNDPPSQSSVDLERLIQDYYKKFICSETK